MQDPFFIIKNVISCFAHDKTHQINLLGTELPWARLEARTALAAHEHVARDRGCPGAQPPPGTTRVTLPAVRGMAVSPRASVSPFTSWGIEPELEGKALNLLRSIKTYNKSSCSSSK